MVQKAPASSRVELHKILAFLLYFPVRASSANSAGMRDLSTLGRKIAVVWTQLFSGRRMNTSRALSCAAMISSVNLLCAQAKSEDLHPRFCIVQSEIVPAILGFERGLQFDHQGNDTLVISMKIGNYQRECIYP